MVRRIKATDIVPARFSSAELWQIATRFAGRTAGVDPFA
jgi:hypothetical protein